KMQIPIQPEKLEPIDHYLITHSHIDHFDPETVGPVLKSQSATKFYCPPDCKTVRDEFFLADKSRFTLVNTGCEYNIAQNIRLIPLPAAHEDLAKDNDGEFIAVSYMLLFDELKTAVFFAGDTITYPGQADMIKNALPDDYGLTLVLPVNGRDAKRSALGFKGNLTLNEAVELYRQCKADKLIPCHFGMFALNDITETMDDAYFTANNCTAIIPEICHPIEL
ncbi:MAG TPA: MBL fold metallo-hydrolase, partial [Phycisphaerae bacterium]|nr:MBL fold metallo-hydrolase [Phycisphaerae bacterium]